MGSEKLEKSLIQFASIDAVISDLLGGSIIVWGTIFYARKAQLVSIQGNLNAARYRDEILHTYPLLSMSGERFTSRTKPDHILHV